MQRVTQLIAAGVLVGLLAPGIVTAQTVWPARLIRIVVPYTTGGAPDIIGRLIGQKLGAGLGQPVVIDNKPGAGGNLGADAVAKSPPDGYTLLLTTTATQSINPSLYANMPYDGIKDFTPVSMVAYTAVMLVVANSVPAKSMRDLVAYAKANPGKLSYASAGVGTVQHISGAMFNGQAGVDTVHVPYKGSGQVMPDLMGGRVSMMFNSVAAVMPMVREGKLRALGVTGTKRSAAAPEVPTFAEAGLPGFDATAWYAVYGPAGLPRDVVQRLNLEIAKVVADPEVRERFATLGLDPASSTPEKLGRITRDDSVKWAKVIKDNNIQTQ